MIVAFFLLELDSCGLFFLYPTSNPRKRELAELCPITDCLHCLIYLQTGGISTTGIPVICSSVRKRPAQPYA